MDKRSLFGLLQRAGMKKIKETGEGYAALCPFHDNTRSPAWGINADTGAWKCWNPDCDAKGGLVDFLVKVVHMSFEEAGKYAANIPQIGTLEADQWRLPAWEDRAKEEEPEKVPERLLGLYAKCPVYMLNRGFPKRFLQEFDIGFDEKGYEQGGHIVGANRVTFPVRSPSGQLVGFTRRSVGDDWPKYLHDFDKAQTMYLAHLVKPGSVLGMTEGPVDALMSRLRARQARGLDPRIHEAMHNMVATLGSGLQVDVIVKLRPAAVYTGFDLWQTNEFGERVPDAAGAAYTDKAIKALHEVGINDVHVLGFPSDDLGALALSQASELSSQTSAAWRWSRPKTRTPKGPQRRR